MVNRCHRSAIDGWVGERPGYARQGWCRARPSPGPRREWGRRSDVGWHRPHIVNAIPSRTGSAPASIPMGGTRAKTRRRANIGPVPFVRMVSPVRSPELDERAPYRSARQPRLPFAALMASSTGAAEALSLAARIMGTETALSCHSI